MSWMSRQPIWNRKRLEQLLSVLPPLITAEGLTYLIYRYGGYQSLSAACQAPSRLLSCPLLADPPGGRAWMTVTTNASVACLLAVPQAALLECTASAVGQVIGRPHGNGLSGMTTA